MRILVTGASGYVGSILIPPLMAAGHELRALAREPARAQASIERALAARDVRRLELGDASTPEIVAGDVVTGVGLDAALSGVEVAYYLIHAMEAGADGSFESRERRGAEQFAAAAGKAGVRRVVYLGGPVPTAGPRSRHLASRLAVEETLLGATPDSVALRASIAIGARSRSFRFLVRLVERMPVLPLPGWRIHRTQPIDERDLVEYLLAAASEAAASGLSLDIVGPDTLTYEQIIDRIRDSMLVSRRALRLGVDGTAVAGPVAAAIAGEDPALIVPLMESLDADLLARDDRAQELFKVHRHSFKSAVEHALRDWERQEPLAAR